MTESQLTRVVMVMLRYEYPQGWFYKSCDRFTHGIPDILGCLDGRFVAIELKTRFNQATRLQDHIMSKIRAAGGIAGVCHSVQEVRNLLRGRGTVPYQAHNLEIASSTLAPRYQY
jgi:hypothetical protein